MGRIVGKSVALIGLIVIGLFMIGAEPTDSAKPGAFLEQIAHKCPLDASAFTEAHDYTACAGLVFAAAASGVFAFEDDKWKSVELEGVGGQDAGIDRIECDGLDLFVRTGSGAALKYRLPETPRVQDLRGLPPTPVSGAELAQWEKGDDGEPLPLGVPCEDVLNRDERDGFIWVGSSLGAARWDGQEWRYLQGPQYLLDDRVERVKGLAGGDGVLVTAAGPTWIEYRPMTLEQKAAIMEAATRARHLRYGLVSDSNLEVPGDLASNRTATSDNDGLWTAMYIAAECYRFAATRDPEAKRFARQSLEALMFLETVTEIPGFVARSFARPDDPHCDGEWDHVTSDGQWRWKGDTSSDEIDGHYYAYSIYYDLCADEAEKEEIRAKVRRISDYIIDHDFFLIDTDGLPTTWGRWNFIGERRALIFNRGLNSLEILSHLKAAYHVTGDQKYQDVYLDLAEKHDYAKFTVRQKIDIPMAINHSDDELAFLSYYPLLKYEDDPKLLKLYRRSLLRSWKIERPERSSLFNFIHGAVMPAGTDFDLAGSIWTLERISTDLIYWDHRNRQRRDIKLSAFPGRFREQESKVPLPPDERTVMKWNGNPYRLDSDGHGAGEEAGTFWLLPYWMGRYYGFIGGG